MFQFYLGFCFDSDCSKSWFSSTDIMINKAKVIQRVTSNHIFVQSVFGFGDTKYYNGLLISLFLYDLSLNWFSLILNWIDELTLVSDMTWYIQIASLGMK